MQTVIRIPVEKYGYIEQEVKGTEEEILAQYMKFRELMNWDREQYLNSTNGFDVHKVISMMLTVMEASPQGKWTMADFDACTELEKLPIHAALNLFKRSPVAKGRIEKRKPNKTKK